MKAGPLSADLARVVQNEGQVDLEDAVDAADGLPPGTWRSKLKPNGAEPPEQPKSRSSRAPRDKSRPRTSKALPFVAFDDVRVDVAKPWIIKGVLAWRETSSWVGGPGKGKSALITDIAVHAAAGRDWRGYRAKDRCAVVILAFERSDLLQRRLEAYRRQHDLQGLPVVVVRSQVDLMTLEAVEILVDTIRSVEERFQLPVGVMALDTFAKAIALGGGDENSAKDQNRVLGHLRLVQERTGVHVALVGHTGKDEAKGARGSNAHLGDVDVMVQFSGDVVRTAVVTKANDQPEGPLTTFMLESFSFGLDEDGDPITTSVVSGEVPDREPKPDLRRGLSDKQRIALDALAEAVINFGEDAPPGFQLPRSIRGVQSGHWRDELFARGALDREAANPRKDFQRIRDALIGRGLIGFRDDFVWRVN